MKKFILLILVSFGSLLAASAQTLYGPFAMINPNHITAPLATIDTATQAAAEGPVTLIIKGTSKTFNICLVTTKISGTIAGTITWLGSNDGVHFGAVVATTALTDQAGVKTYVYKEIDRGFPFYQALITQTGTSSLSYSATWYNTPYSIGK